MSRSRRYAESKARTSYPGLFMNLRVEGKVGG